MSPRSCFGSIMIIIHSMFSASGFVEQLLRHLAPQWEHTSTGSSSAGWEPGASGPPPSGAQRGLLRLRQRLNGPRTSSEESRAQGEVSVGLPEAEFHRARLPARGRLSSPAGEQDRRPAGHSAGRVTMATLGVAGGGATAGGARPREFRAHASRSFLFPPLRGISGSRGTLPLSACAKWTRRYSAARACALRASPPPLAWASRWGGQGTAGEGERNGNRKRKRRARVNRFSLQSGGFCRASSCPRARPRSPAPSPNRPNCRRPAPSNRPPAGRQADSERPSAGGGAPALRAAALAPWRCCRLPAASPARVPARRPRCLTRNSCGPSKMETWMR